MKVGKTTFAATQLPNALLLAFERGYSAIPNVKAIDIQKWSDFKKVVKQLDSDKAKETYLTIIFDTIDIAAQLCEEYICQQNGVRSFAEVPFGALYKEYTRELSTVFRKITMMGYGIVFIAQEEVKVVKNNKGEDIEKLQPMIDKRALKVANALVDFILYIGTEWDNEGRSTRYFYTRNTPFITAGSRFGEMNPKIPFTYEALVNEIGKAMESSVKGNEGLLTDDKVCGELTYSRPFSETMAEAGKVWTQFPNTAEWNERKMSIVKEYFGQPIKLSSATESQQDLVEGVIEDLKELLDNME